MDPLTELGRIHPLSSAFRRQFGQHFIQGQFSIAGFIDHTLKICTHPIRKGLLKLIQGQVIQPFPQLGQFRQDGLPHGLALGFQVGGQAVQDHPGRSHRMVLHAANHGLVMMSTEHQGTQG